MSMNDPSRHSIEIHPHQDDLAATKTKLYDAWPADWTVDYHATYPDLGRLTVWRSTASLLELRVSKWSSRPLWRGEIVGTALVVMCNSPEGCVEAIKRGIEAIRAL